MLVYSLGYLRSTILTPHLPGLKSLELYGDTKSMNRVSRFWTYRHSLDSNLFISFLVLYTEQ